MDLTGVANRLNDSYGCELITDEDDKNLSSLSDEDIVSIHFPDGEETLDLYVNEVTTYLNNCDKGRILDNLEYIGVDKYLLRIQPHNDAAFQYFQGDHYDLSTPDNVTKYGRLISLEKQSHAIRNKLLSDPIEREDFQKQFNLSQKLEEEIAEIKSEIISPTDSHFEIQIRHKDCDISFSVIQGATEFGLWISKIGSYDKWFPPVLDEDLFIEIKYTNRLQLDECRLFAEKFIHELSAQMGIEVRKEGRPFLEEDYPGDSKIDDIRKKSLLIFSTNNLSKELYSLYHKAITANDNDFTILNHMKIIEFVSQTVSRIQMYNVVRAKLEERESISPSVHFIEELRKTYDKLKLQNQDRELIKMTIHSCCDIDCIEIPECTTLQFLMEAKSSGDKQKIKGALKSLADILYATRNQIAHAKMNYQKTGDECPPEDQPSLIACLKSISEQCIRWFESQAEWMKYSD